MSRETHGQVRRKGTVLSMEAPHNLIFACRQPMSDLRGEQANADNHSQMVDGLKVARVMPSEDFRACSLTANQISHRLHPSRMLERFQPSFKRSLRLPCSIAAAQRVAVSTNRSRDGLECRADSASASRKPIRRPRHLGRSRAATRYCDERGEELAAVGEGESTLLICH